ncbi:hypothetical protein FDG2_6046 [Candidatus Protofrankia californiensis]|uniref:Ferredoxin n=1 Tax=Candidatus Protofrankia californiensis TaxID=1839754 RepID=A0A1C3PG40_9ACTN|nr:hypothetical protein FDG2_6046 [Candidatus Protofrankia californiensis]
MAGVNQSVNVTLRVERCIGAGQCVRAAPDVFEQDESAGTVVLLAGMPPPDRWDAVRRAVALCPSQAVTFDPR